VLHRPLCASGWVAVVGRVRRAILPMDSDEFALIHKALAEEFEGSDCASPERLAIHYFAAGQPAQAMRYGLEAAELSAQLGMIAQADAEREYFDLFIGVGRGELSGYGSYYLTGFLNGRPLARLREDLHALGIKRVEAQSESEDHAAILCEIMAGLIGGQFPATVEGQQQIFEKHLAPWIGRFFADMVVADAADFYRHVGAIGHLFIEIETQALALTG